MKDLLTLMFTGLIIGWFIGWFIGYASTNVCIKL